MDDLGLIIDGRSEPGNLTLDVVDPATGQPFVQVARADRAQLDAAVATAKRAFPAWAALQVEQRRTRLLGLADALEARSEEFSFLLTRDQGKTLAEPRFELGGAVGVQRGMAGLDLSPRVLIDEPGRRVLEHRTPLGIVAAIVPWNFPLLF